MDKRSCRLYSKACKMLGVNPDKVRLVGPAEYRAIAGYGTSNYEGVADKEKLIVYVKRWNNLTTYIHELLHIIYLTKPHWWIYAAAWKLTGVPITPGKGKAYGYGQGCFVDTQRMKELPSKARLIKLIRSQSKKRNLL